MTPKEEFDKLIRKEVRELLKRQVYFSREILALISQNFSMKRKLIIQSQKLKILKEKLKELTARIEITKKRKS